VGTRLADGQLVIRVPKRSSAPVQIPIAGSEAER
jgi:hypothetical protein